MRDRLGSVCGVICVVLAVGCPGRNGSLPTSTTSGSGSAAASGGTAGAGGRAGTSAAGSGGAAGGACSPNIALPAVCRVCADGSCGLPECSNGAFKGEWTCPEDAQPADCDCGRDLYVPVCGTDGKTHDATCGRQCVPVPIACDGECPCKSCVVGGCSSQLCSDAASGSLVSTCEWREEYGCYRTATCARQVDGKCGWTPSPELEQCLAEVGGGAELHWYATCGDPVCSSDSDPSDRPDIPNCTTEKLGDACSSEGAQCDGVLDCGASLICAKSDPAARPGGCPISRARFKDGIEYLSPEQLRAYHDQLVSIPLASYQYKHAPGAGPQLGFVIEDIEPSVAVAGDHVNLYGYLSMAVAAIKVQQAQIDSLQRELGQLREQLPSEGAAPLCE